MIPFQILKLSIVRKNKISVPLRKKCQPQGPIFNQYSEENMEAIRGVWVAALVAV